MMSNYVLSTLQPSNILLHNDQWCSQHTSTIKNHCVYVCKCVWLQPSNIFLHNGVCVRKCVWVCVSECVRKCLWVCMRMCRDSCGFPELIITCLRAALTVITVVNWPSRGRDVMAIGVMLIASLPVTSTGPSTSPCSACSLSAPLVRYWLY